MTPATIAVARSIRLLIRRKVNGTEGFSARGEDDSCYPNITLPIAQPTNPPENIETPQTARCNQKNPMLMIACLFALFHLMRTESIWVSTRFTLGTRIYTFALLLRRTS